MFRYIKISDLLFFTMTGLFWGHIDVPSSIESMLT